jgi:hypothetical protein
MKSEVHAQVSRAIGKLSREQEKLFEQWGRKLADEAWNRAPTFDVDGRPIFSLKIRDARWVQAALYALLDRPITEEESKLMDLEQALLDLEALVRD